MKRFKTASGSNSDLFISKKIEFKEFDLPNGLHCALYKDNTNPIVNVTLGYKVGSRDEEKNKKGIAHLFEHMMFQGSENIKKNQHFEYVMKSGGTCNAFTMQDATVYYEVMPSNNLEMALWLESERMNSLDISEENLSNQKSVVLEEKKQRYDNTPYGMMFHNIFKNVFKGSDYESSVIGETDDINSFNVKEAIDFHYNYYSPKNTVLVVAGDIDYIETKELIFKYFSGIKKEINIRRNENIIKAIEKDIDLTVYDNVQLPLLNLCYQIPKAGSKEDYNFEYFAEIIANNKSSRLYRKLVYEKRLIKSIRAMKYTLEDAGVIVFKAMINPGTNIEFIKNEILNEFKEFAANGITDPEFKKIQNQLEFDNTQKYLKLMNICFETVFNYIYYKDISRINSEIDNYLSVCKQDVINSVEKYILGKNKLSVTYLPMI
ncbi:MAG: insulinase family protein [Bacteroidota bacterium]|nr:insulinase family protein [Bacteroidota bacterium]